MKEIEATAISCALQYEEVLDDFSSLTENDFIEYRDIARAIFSLYEKAKNIDVVSVKRELEKMDVDCTSSKISKIAGVAYSPYQISTCVEQLQEATARRELKDLAAMVQDKADDKREDIKDLMVSVGEALDVISTEPKKELESLGDLVEKRYNDYLTDNIAKGVPTGLSGIDSAWTGFFPSELTIVAGRPSMGKTVFAQLLAMNVAIHTGKPSVIFSLEMAGEYLADRYLSTATGQNVELLRQGLNKKQLEKQRGKVDELTKAPVYIYDDPNSTTFDILAQSRKLKRREGLSLVVVDFLTLLNDGKGRGESEHLRVANLTRKLRSIATTLEVPVLVLAQLSRGVEGRQEKRPLMSDLRESGGIEEAADNILLLYRDEYYNQNTENKNILEIDIAKQKQGARGVKCKVHFDPRKGQFTDLEWGTEIKEGE